MRWFWLIVVVAGIATIAILMRAPQEQAPSVAAPDPQPAAAPPVQTVLPPDPKLAAEPPPQSAAQPSSLFPGTGSTTDPYRVNWPLLKAADAGAQRDGSVIVPKDIALLDGTSVEISGYLAAPVARDETDELLVMQKRWDGCCIGTPPTPFDCIEVRLDQSVTVRGRHLIQFGTVRGVLRIEPFTAGRFLLGLYRIEHGTVDGFSQSN